MLTNNAFFAVSFGWALYISAAVLVAKAVAVCNKWNTNPLDTIVTQAIVVPNGGNSNE